MEAEFQVCMSQMKHFAQFKKVLMGSISISNAMFGAI